MNSFHSNNSDEARGYLKRCRPHGSPLLSALNRGRPVLATMLFPWFVLSTPSACRQATSPNTGPVRWSYVDELPAAVPSLDGERVAFTTSLGQNRLNVVDRSSGRLVWTRSFDVPVDGVYGMPLANIAPFEDLLIVPAWHLYGIDRATGATRWRFTRPDDFPGARWVVVADGTVFTCGKRLYAVDARTGTLKWELNLNEEPFDPVYAYGKLYLTTRGNRGAGALGAGHAVAINPADGSVLWKFPLPDARDASWIGGSVGVAGVTETQVIVPSRNGRVYALDRETGALQWERRGRGPYDRGTVLHSVVVVGGDALYVEAIELKSGKLAWEIRTEASTQYIGIAPGLAIVNDGRLRAVNERGQTVWSYGGDFHDEPNFVRAPVYADRTIFVGGSIGQERRGLYAIEVPF
jgi:outer membrane protein assembly factor BamB